MKPLSSKKKWLLAAIAFLLALFILKIALLLTAKPKIAVNYVAEYNRMTRPENCDPNENAAPHCQKAFDTFVEMPHELIKPYADWPTDFNSTEQALLEEWLASNSQAFEYFRTAVNKPYYWLQRQSKRDNSMFSIMFPELSPLRTLTRAVSWQAKLNTSKGRFKKAFEDILDCYRAGCQKCRTPSFLTDQHAGLGTKQTATSIAFVILDRTLVNNTSLKFFQDALRAELTEDTYVPDIQTEKLILYDALQRTFIDNGRGTGRLAWRRAWYFDTMCGRGPNILRRLNCFIGPTRNQIAEQIEQLFSSFELLKTRTPWQLHNQDDDYFTKIEAIHHNNFFLGMLGTNPRRIFQLHHKVRAQTEAILTILAVLRFKADNNRIPETLDKLVSAGYLQSVPMDPYSDEPLVYKPEGNNFRLYSLGQNFEDDGGLIGDSFTSTSLWSSSGPNPFSPDIVYWPVQRLERPQR